ncbi:FAD-dependent monooxygenase [Isoptericola aurantiacus]|uniref:FAD-dependent monooxygenase n=1 Tax=Isoptericola aurantiacus TaxID=3377839 RepID=UPI00383B170D
MHARSLEVLDARGLADPLSATGTRVPTVRLFSRLEVPLDGLPGRFPFVLVTPQDEVERLLRSAPPSASTSRARPSSRRWSWPTSGCARNPRTC